MMQRTLRVSIKPQTVKMQFLMIGALHICKERKNQFRTWAAIEKALAWQGILTYCANRTLPYSMYADGSGLLVFAPFSTSGSLSKKLF